MIHTTLNVLAPDLRAAGRIEYFAVERARQHTLFEREHRDGGFDNASSAERVAGPTLGLTRDGFGGK